MAVPLVLWGTYDVGKPRVRNLMAALEQLYPDVKSSHFNLWSGVEDKSGIPLKRIIAIAARLLCCYPWLLYRYCRLPAHQVVVLPYPCIFDALVLWPFAKCRGAKLCCDLFLSLYDTAVVDRHLIKEASLAARLLYRIEWLAIKLADFVLIDTQSHKDYLCRLYSIDSEKVHVVWVGADDSFSKHSPKSPRVTSDQTQVLFYGQFIPLHGLDHLVQAISRIEALGREDITFHIVGTGQEAAHIDAMITEMGIRSILRTPWVDYSQLPTLIAAADICLGIFPTEGKGGRVIPNKLFQIMAVGRPVVTAETSGICEILQPGPGVRLTAMGDSEDIANKILDLVDCLNDATQQTREIEGAMSLPSIGPKQISLQFKTVLSDYLPTDLNDGARQHDG